MQILCIITLSLVQHTDFRRKHTYICSASDDGDVTMTKLELIVPAKKAEEDERVTDWRSLYVASAIAFVGCVQFSLFFSSLWPYLKLVSALFVT